MRSPKEAILVIIALALVVWSFYAFLNKPASAPFQPKTEEGNAIAPYQKSASLGSEIRVGSSTISVEIADTNAEREQGLSGRGSLASGHGMLFVFDTPGLYGFWMKDMRFPLDIVWIDRDFNVVGVEKNLSPDSYPQIFAPKSAIKYALELPAGDSRKFGIDTGVQMYLLGQK